MLPYLQVHIPPGEEVLVFPVLAAEASTEILRHISPPQHLDVCGQVPVEHDGVGEFCGGVSLAGVSTAVLRDYHTWSLEEVGSDLDRDHLRGGWPGSMEDGGIDTIVSNALPCSFALTLCQTHHIHPPYPPTFPKALTPCHTHLPIHLVMPTCPTHIATPACPTHLAPPTYPST